MKFGRSARDNNLPPESSKKVRKCRSKNSKRSPVKTTPPSPPNITKSWTKTIWTRVVNTVQDAVYRLRAGHRRNYKLIPLKNHRNIVEVMMPPDEGLGVNNIIFTNSSNNSSKDNSNNQRMNNKSSTNTSRNKKTSSSNVKSNSSSNNYSSENYSSSNYINNSRNNNIRDSRRDTPYSNTIRAHTSSENNRRKDKSYNAVMCTNNSNDNNSSNNSNYNSNSNQTTKLYTSRKYRTRNTALREKSNNLSGSGNHVSSSRRETSKSPCRFERTLASTSTSHRSRSRSRSISEDLNTNKNTNKSNIKNIISSFNPRNNICSTKSSIKSSFNSRNNNVYKSSTSNNMYSSSSSSSCGHSNGSSIICHNKDRVSNNKRFDIVTDSGSSINNSSCFSAHKMTSSNRNNNSRSYHINKSNTKSNTNINNNNTSINSISIKSSSDTNNNSSTISNTNSNNNNDNINSISITCSTNTNNNSSTDGNNNSSTISRSTSSTATATANYTTTNSSNNRINTRHLVRERTPSFRDALYQEGLLAFSEPTSGRPVLSIARGFYNSELEAMSSSSTDEQRYKDSLSQLPPAQMMRYQRLFLPQHALEPLVDGLPESVWLTWLETSLPYLATLNAVKHRKSNLSRKKASMSVADCCYASHGDYQHVPFLPLTLGMARLPYVQHAHRRFAGPLLDLPNPGPVRGARRQRLQYQPYPRPGQLRGHA